MKEELEKTIEGMLNDEGLRQLGNDKFYSLVERLTDLCTDLKKMPDGRPFFAWENELKMLREENKSLAPKQKKVNDMMRLLHIAKIESEHEPWTGDLVIRFRIEDQVKSLTSEMKYRRDRS